MDCKTDILVKWNIAEWCTHKCLYRFIFCPHENITPSTVTMHPPEISASSRCLVIVFSAMIKVSFKALGMLITHCWLHNESQGGGWLRMPSFIIASLEWIKLMLSQCSLEGSVTDQLQRVTEVTGGLSGLISAWKTTCRPFEGGRCFPQLRAASNLICCAFMSQSTQINFSLMCLLDWH